MKKEIASFGKFYSKTLEAFGGPKGLEKWLLTKDEVPTHVAHVFRVENERLLCEADEFDEVGKSDVMVAVCEALPDVVKSNLFLVVK